MSSTFVVLDVGLWPTTIGNVATFSLTVPAGLQGNAIVFQSGAFAPQARNGNYQATTAHRVLLQ